MHTLTFKHTHAHTHTHLSSSVGPCGVIESSSQPSPITCGLPVCGFLCSSVSFVIMYLLGERRALTDSAERRGDTRARARAHTQGEGEGGGEIKVLISRRRHSLMNHSVKFLPSTFPPRLSKMYSALRDEDLSVVYDEIDGGGGGGGGAGL